MFASRYGLCRQSGADFFAEGFSVYSFALQAGLRRSSSGLLEYTYAMLQYHAAFYLPKSGDRMVVAQVLDFEGVVSQGFDLADARAMIASALEEMAELYLEEGRPLPVPSPAAADPEADYVELIPLTIAVGATRPVSATPGTRAATTK
jgi:predicted RNase H-like HicB family nuclease